MGKNISVARRGYKRGGKITEETSQLIVDAYNDGRPIREIASEFGIHHTTVYAHLKKNMFHTAMKRGEPLENSLIGRMWIDYVFNHLSFDGLSQKYNLSVRQARRYVTEFKPCTVVYN